MKRRLGKQIICFMLSIAILVSAVPVTAQAAATDPAATEAGMPENLTGTENDSASEWKICGEGRLCL